MNKKMILAVALALTAGVAVSGASCWRTLRNGSFTENACSGPAFDLTAAFVPAWDFAELRNTSEGSTPLASSGARCAGATVRKRASSRWPRRPRRPAGATAVTAAGLAITTSW